MQILPNEEKWKNWKKTNNINELELSHLIELSLRVLKFSEAELLGHMLNEKWLVKSL